MRKMFNYKSLLIISLCLIMLIALGGYGFANNGSVDRDFVKNVKIVEKTVSKQFDKNHDKIFENLNEKLQKSDNSSEIPVIVMFNEKVSQSKKNEISNLIGSYQVKYEFENIHGMATKLNKHQIDILANLDFVRHIEYDETVYAVMDTADYWFGAEKARTDFNVEGDKDGSLSQYSKDDVVVAVIDTGIDNSHVDLDGDKVIGWKDYVNGKSSPYDDNGHGTHVSGIIAGEGDGNPNYGGVAKGTALVGVKALDRKGNGYMSDVTAAIDWCVTYKDTYGIDIINMSLGTSTSSDGTDSTSQVVNIAVDNGIVVVVAAGNFGPAEYTIGSPGAAEKAICVGAMADVGQQGFNLAYFSSRGPTADDRTKPDICSPGYQITAADAGSSNGYVVKDGTSMATPFTAGTIALMLDADPSLSPTNIKNILASTAKDWGPNNKDIDYGEGRLDAYEAIKQAGGFSGTNIVVPNHIFKSETINTENATDIWEFEVTDTSYPIAVTLIMPDWTISGWPRLTTDPDFDVYLLDSNGNTLDSATSVDRQETINFQPTQTGTYKIEVYSYSGTGNYFFDLSAGTNSITLTQDQ